MPRKVRMSAGQWPYFLVFHYCFRQWMPKTSNCDFDYSYSIDTNLWIR